MRLLFEKGWMSFSKGSSLVLAASQSGFPYGGWSSTGKGERVMSILFSLEVTLKDGDRAP